MSAMDDGVVDTKVSSAADVARAAGKLQGIVIAVVLGVSMLLLTACGSAPPAGSGTGGTTKPAPPGTGATPAALEQMNARAQPAPAWMVGKFTGTDLRSGLTNVALDVNDKGRIFGRIHDITAEGQYIGNSRILWAHGNESIVEKRAGGFRVVQVKDPANAIDYRPR